MPRKQKCLARVGDSDHETRWLKALRSDATRLFVSVNGFTRVRVRWEFSGRRVQEHLLYLVDQNRIDFHTEGKTFRMDAGSFVWLAPGIPFGVSGNDLGKPVRLIHLRIGVEDDAGPVPPPFRMRFLRRTDRILPVMQLLHRSLLASRPKPGAMGRSLLHTLTLLVQEDGRLAPGEDDHWWTPERRGRLERYVAMQIERSIPPREIANLFDLSPDYFTRVFRQEFGIPPRKWLHQERLRAAGEMLVESEATISEIADRFGFTDLFQFSRQFRKAMGVSPTAYRRRFACSVLRTDPVSRTQRGSA